MNALRAIPSTDARLLEFVILTVSRAGAARLARFDQVDLRSGVWRVPAAQMKDGRFRKGEPFVVPLASRALEIVEGMRRPGVSPSAFIFSDGSDEPLNDTGADLAGAPDVPRSAMARSEFETMDHGAWLAICF